MQAVNARLAQAHRRISKKREKQLQTRETFLVEYKMCVKLQMIFVSVNSPGTNMILGS